MGEMQVKKLRELLRDTLKKSLIPMEAYALEYNKFLDLHGQDITEYVKYVLLLLSTWCPLCRYNTLSHIDHSHVHD